MEFKRFDATNETRNEYQRQTMTDLSSFNSIDE